MTVVALGEVGAVLGCSQISVDIAGETEANVHSLIELLKARCHVRSEYGECRDIWDQVCVLVNGVDVRAGGARPAADRQACLKDGDRVTLYTPMAGG